MNVILVGPVKPFRGGIAHSCNNLARELARKHSLRVISFSRLYPKSLYPGREQKEPDEKKLEGISVRFAIDSINPLSWLQAFSEIRKHNPERVVFAWWHTFFAPCYFTIAVFTKFFTKAKVGAVCMNVLPHEESLVHSILARIFFSQCDYFVTYSKADLELLGRLLPKARAAFMPEPTFEAEFGKKAMPKGKAKKKLGLKGNNLLFFGFVRPYKGLKYLLEAMPVALEKADFTLVIAGEFWEDREEYLKKMRGLGIEDKIKIVDRYLSAEEVRVHFSAADAVVMPYISSTESGIIQLAFSYSLPVIATAVGGNTDYIKNGVNGLLVEPENAGKLAEAITNFYAKKLGAGFRTEMVKSKSIFEWNEEKEAIILGKWEREKVQA